jgi:hypothetical protein
MAQKTYVFSKIRAEDFSNLAKDVNIHVGDGYRTPNRQGHKRASPQIIFKLSKIKKKNANSHLREPPLD